VQPRGSIVVSPATLPGTILMGTFIFYISLVFARGALVVAEFWGAGGALEEWEREMVAIAFGVSSFISALFCAYLSTALHQCSRERWQQNDEILSRFHFEELCKLEDDPDVVTILEDQITDVLIDLGYIRDQSQENHGIAIFNRLVRNHCALAIEVGLPRNGFSYSQILFLTQAYFWKDCDRMAGIVMEGAMRQVLGGEPASVHALSGQFCKMVSLYCAVFPLLFAALNNFVRRNLQMDWGCIVFYLVGFMTFEASFLISTGLDFLKYFAVKEKQTLLSLAMWVLTFGLLYATRKVYGPRQSADDKANLNKKKDKG